MDSSSGSSCEEGEDGEDGDLEAPFGFKTTDLECLQNLLSKFTVYTRCRRGSISVMNCHDTGLATVLWVKCFVCDYSGNAPLNRKFGRSFELNRQSVLAMRCIGRGWSALEKFCGIKNLPAPVPEPAFSSHQKVLLAATQEVAAKALVRAAAVLRTLTDSNKVTITTRLP